MYRCRQRTVALALVLAWVGQVGFVLTFYFCARTLWDGQPDNPLPSLAQHFLIVPVGLVISAVPLFPGGAGIGEAGFGGLYAWFGSGAANGVLGSLVQRVLTWAIALLGYVVCLTWRGGLPAGDGPAPAGEAGSPAETATAKPGGALLWDPAQTQGSVAR